MQQDSEASNLPSHILLGIFAYYLLNVLIPVMRSLSVAS